MKLRYHTIVGGRYFKAGEDVPDELVSPAIAKYAISADEPLPKPKQTMRPLTRIRARNRFDGSKRPK